MPQESSERIAAFVLATDQLADLLITQTRIRLVNRKIEIECSLPKIAEKLWFLCRYLGLAAHQVGGIHDLRIYGGQVSYEISVAQAIEPDPWER